MTQSSGRSPSIVPVQISGFSAAELATWRTPQLELNMFSMFSKSMLTWRTLSVSPLPKMKSCRIRSDRSVYHGFSRPKRSAILPRFLLRYGSCSMNALRAVHCLGSGG